MTRDNGWNNLINYGLGQSPLRGLATARSPLVRRKRISSYDRTGGNRDHFSIPRNKWTTIAEINSPGIINHIWMTYAAQDKFAGRKVALRFFWDGSDKPGVIAPIGDFFGLGHGLHVNYSCAVLSASPKEGKALNSWFPMPFRKGMRLEVLNESDKDDMPLYMYLDYEEYPDGIPDEFLYFHAHWRRENPCDGLSRDEMEKTPSKDWLFMEKHLSGEGNYVILDIKGRGHYVGCNLHVTNLRFTPQWNWWGEGDDMIFIDGEKWPPSLHGTGSEDYFNTAWCPQEPVREPYHGIVMGGDANWAGRISFYRYHVEDPIPFQKSIRVTIEHGHANRRSDDYSSTAYWYSNLNSHDELADLPSLENRMPPPLMHFEGENS